MDGFKVIRLREKTIQRFKLFSKKVSKTYSGTLEIMIDFFEWHNYSPHQRFAKDISAGQEVNRKRIEASIAISKSIEKAQNIPLTNIETMLRSLWTYYIRLDIRLRELLLHNLTLNYVKTKKELLRRI